MKYWSLDSTAITLDSTVDATWDSTIVPSVGEILLGVSDFMPILLLNSEMVIELDKRSELSPTLELESELI